MKTTTKMLFAVLMALVSMAVDAQQLAFPGAQGWGRFATGGRNGSVYHVTNLNDSGSGSLRDAVSQANRIIVFDVAGVIRINSRLVFKSNITVAGQTAPGEGVTVYGDGMSCSGASNVIVRYMRFRMGSVGTKDADCAGLANGGNMIFDHCSFAWAQDENFSINWDNKGTAPHDVTIQNSIVGQGLMQHSAGGLIQADNITMYRVLLCDNKTRNFKVKGRHQYVNNIVYNWSTYAYEMGGESEGESFANAVGNLFINGNSTSTTANGFSGGNSGFHFYGSDNWQDRNKDGVFNPELFTGNGGGDRQSTPYDYPELDVWPGNTLVDNLLPIVGASLPYRDITDAYMVNEVLSFGKKGNLITSEKDLPYGTPDTWKVFAGTKRADSDNDGIPDDWETANGLNPNDKSDAMKIAANGYANIENYVNGITKDDRQFFLRAPMLLKLASSTTSSLTLEWSDFTDNEEGFIVEMKKDGNFVEMGRTAANVNTYTISDASLTPGSPYVVRVCAYQGENKSEYTAEQTVKTRPEQVDIIDAEAFAGDGDGEWLIAPTADETVTLSEVTPKTAVVVRSDANVTLNGTGYISGSASLSKTGNGKLTVATDQQYEGASVLHNGIWEFSSLKNGGVASGLGKSQEFAQNWVMDGGTYRYTGGTTSTNRSAQLYDNTELNIANKATVVTMNGSVEGQGNLEIGGEGTIGVNTADFFKFDGNVVMKGGTLKLNKKEISDKGIGSASKLVMQGGTFVTVGKNEATVTYNFPIEAVAGTTSTVDFDLWNENRCVVTGTGTLIWNVHYLREYIKGSWDGFTGHLIVNGTGNAGQSQFAIQNGVGVKNATIELKGTASVNGAKNESTFYLGGLSGDATTFLHGFNVKAKGSGTWVVGGANTNETFRGVIDNLDQAGSHPGTTTIVKTGSGYWRLTGKNIYSGTTTVNGGTLIVNGQHTGTGAVTVAKGATLAGKGSLAAAVTLNGTLMIGDTLVSDNGLKFNGGLKLGSGAILSLNEAMMEAPHYDGDQIQAFTGKVTGTFAAIQPATPGENQTWDTSELYSKGILKVVGGSQKPDDPIVGPDEPQGETKLVCLAWGNMSRLPSDAACTEMTGAEASPSNNIGFSMNYTTATDKTYAKGEKMTYEFDGVQRTGIKLSNGAQNVIHVPDGYKVTKLTLWSVVGTNVSSRTSYWKEVAGKTYTEADGQLLDLTKTAASPNKAVFVLNNVERELTFTNAGEQQSVVIVLEYHTGGTSTAVTPSGLNAASVRTEYYTLSGERVAQPVKGMYIQRSTTADGKVSSRKVMR